MPEKDLQTQCSDYLRSRDILFYHKEKGRGIDKSHSKGLPDLLIWNSYKSIFIELKDEKGKQNLDQETWQLRSLKAGIPYCICYTFEEFIVTLQLKGII